MAKNFSSLEFEEVWSTWAVKYTNSVWCSGSSIPYPSYGYVWNVHRMSLKIEHRNLEIRKTRYDFSVQVRNFLLPLSLKFLRHKERDTHSFYPGFFICPPPRQHVWHPSQSSPRASESQPSSPEAEPNSTNWLFQNPKIFRVLLVRDIIALASPVSHVGYWDISEWHIRSARAHEHLCLCCT